MHRLFIRGHFQPTALTHPSSKYQPSIQRILGNTTTGVDNKNTKNVLLNSQELRLYQHYVHQLRLQSHSDTVLLFLHIHNSTHSTHSHLNVFNHTTDNDIHIKGEWLNSALFHRVIHKTRYAPLGALVQGPTLLVTVSGVNKNTNNTNKKKKMEGGHVLACLEKAWTTLHSHHPQSSLYRMNTSLLPHYPLSFLHQQAWNRPWMVLGGLMGDQVWSVGQLEGWLRMGREMGVLGGGENGINENNGMEGIHGDNGENGMNAINAITTKTRPGQRQAVGALCRVLGQGAGGQLVQGVLRPMAGVQLVQVLSRHRDHQLLQLSESSVGESSMGESVTV